MTGHGRPGAASTAAQFATDAARFAALERRDVRAEGSFWYSVASTGVYCRPTCAARLPRRENIAFHLTPGDAERAGFRACKRCRPAELSHHERQAELIAATRACLDEADGPLSLAALASKAGLSSSYLQRIFKRSLGVTPREYASARRLQKVESELSGGAPVTAAIYEAGYLSSSRFYESDSRALGLLPGELRRGGQGVTIRAVVRACSLGRVLVAATVRGLCAVELGDEDGRLKEQLRLRFPHATLLEGDAGLAALAEQVVALIDGAELGATLPLDLMGTVFQQRVWRALGDIPVATTRSYSELARQLRAPGAARAVGAACGKNPIAVLIPCHRVLRDDGSLGGYRWGLYRKQQLLAREAGTTRGLSGGELRRKRAPGRE